MDGVWNLWDVKPPPVCFVKTEIQSKEISNLNDVTFNALKTMRDLDFLNREAAILSRFLYKHRRIFRHDKGIQNLVKINQCLKRYLKLDLTGVFSSLKQNTSRNTKQKTTTAYLPTRQMLKWVLLRLQAFSKLFIRVIDLTKETGAHIYKKLCLGWSLNLFLLVFCLTARLLATSKFLVAKSMEWYSSFYKCLPHLRETAEFLPGYDFPTDLKVWLGNVDLVPLRKKTLIDDVFELIDLAKDEEDEGDGEDDSEVKIVNERLVKVLFKTNIINIDSDIEEVSAEGKKVEKKGVKRPAGQTDEDFGVPVDDENEDEEADETPVKREKKFKRRRGGKRVKWLNKMKQTLGKYEKSGASAVSSESHY